MSAARRADQQGGNPLFRVERERVGQPRSWRNGSAVVDRIRLRLEELRAPNGEKLEEAISQAFSDGIAGYLRDRGFAIHDYSMRMVIHHNSGTQLWTGSPVLPLNKWLEGSERSRAWMDKLAKELNSSEGLNATSGEFYAELLFSKNPVRGSGCRGKKNNPGSLSYKDILKKKRCIIQIKNKDELCPARAIVTMKARENQDPEYRNIMQQS